MYFKCKGIIWYQKCRCRARAGSFVTLVLNFLIVVSRVSSNLLVVLLQGSKVLTGFREFTLFHTLTNVPMDKCTLGVHEIKLVVKMRPCLSNRGGVRKHADGTVNLGEIAIGDMLGRLVADTDLEACRAPIDNLDRLLGLDGSNSLLDILVHNITAVQQAGSHVLTVP